LHWEPLIPSMVHEVNGPKPARAVHSSRAESVPHNEKCDFPGHMGDIHFRPARSYFRCYRISLFLGRLRWLYAIRVREYTFLSASPDRILA